MVPSTTALSSSRFMEHTFPGNSWRAGGRAVQEPERSVFAFLGAVPVVGQGLGKRRGLGADFFACLTRDLGQDLRDWAFLGARALDGLGHQIRAKPYSRCGTLAEISTCTSSSSFEGVRIRGRPCP